MVALTEPRCQLILLVLLGGRRQGLSEKFLVALQDERVVEAVCVLHYVILGYEGTSARYHGF